MKVVVRGARRRSAGEAIPRAEEEPSGSSGQVADGHAAFEVDGLRPEDEIFARLGEAGCEPPSCFTHRGRKLGAEIPAALPVEVAPRGTKPALGDEGLRMPCDATFLRFYNDVLKSRGLGNRSRPWTTVRLDHDENCAVFECGLRVEFRRALRVDGGDLRGAYQRGLGVLPLCRAHDFREGLPVGWRRRGGAFAALRQREAMWVNFDCRFSGSGGCAVKVRVGNTNAVSGRPWEGGLNSDPLDHIVCPNHAWLAGINDGNGGMRQFGPMPLNSGGCGSLADPWRESHTVITLEVYPPLRSDVKFLAADVSGTEAGEGRRDGDASVANGGPQATPWREETFGDGGRDEGECKSVCMHHGRGCACMHGGCEGTRMQAAVCGGPDRGAAAAQGACLSPSEMSVSPTGSGNGALSRADGAEGVDELDSTMQAPGPVACVSGPKHAPIDPGARPRSAAGEFSFDPETTPEECGLRPGDVVWMEAVALGTRPLLVSDVAGTSSPDVELTARYPFGVCVRTLVGADVPLTVCWATTGGDLKLMIEDCVGVPPVQQGLTFAGRRLQDEAPIGDQGVGEGAVIHLVSHVRGSDVFEQSVEGKLLRLCDAPQGHRSASMADCPRPSHWDLDAKQCLRLAILTTADFRAVTGQDPPPTPVSALTYHSHGVPWRDCYDAPAPAIDRAKILVDLAASASFHVEREDIMEERTCPVCRYNACNAELVPCGHGFCADCAEAVADIRPIKCPVCRGRFTRIADWSQALGEADAAMEADDCAVACLHTESAEGVGGREVRPDGELSVFCDDWLSCLLARDCPRWRSGEDGGSGWPSSQ
ncbi:unnamed protein product [Ostreobium quekettii]|uniref:Ubiquitin-like domain-containing protein n=1 Tax=Ostreobium quekettii TaxID=121088 RepID=A0A8S1J7S2_9CHLO|nr:unnamed protein product [Ostreobium quekettii]|eukprot:evm.model.scf_229.11 EVM.evm.TU.scf_229.11   scf_229:91702-95201(-)